MKFLLAHRKLITAKTVKYYQNGNEISQNRHFNLDLTLLLSHFFVLKMLPAFYVCCIYSSALQARFFHGSKQYEP